MKNNIKNKKILFYEKILENNMKKAKLYDNVFEAEKIIYVNDFDSAISHLEKDKIDILLIETGNINETISNQVFDMRNRFPNIIIVVLSITHNLNLKRDFLEIIDLYIKRPTTPFFVLNELTQYLEVYESKPEVSS